MKEGAEKKKSSKSIISIKMGCCSVATDLMKAFLVSKVLQLSINLMFWNESEQQSQIHNNMYKKKKKA